MPQLDPGLPATLYRSRADWPRERAAAEMEEIGAGSLATMIRLALTDPDAEYWPYRIVVAETAFDGLAIVALDRQLRGVRRRPAR